MMLTLPKRRLILPDAPSRGHARRLLRPTRAIFPFPAIAILPISPGTYNLTAPGTYYWVCPNYNTINFDIRGSGGGGGAGSTNSGAAGNGSSVSTPSGISADGGNGGAPTNYANGSYGANGGAFGPSNAILTTGAGNLGGAGGYEYYPDVYTSYTGGTGGAGGRCQVRWHSGDTNAPFPGMTLTIIVGGGGAGGAYGGGNSAAGSPGTNGSIHIDWS
jgi:hypothetical protein